MSSNLLVVVIVIAALVAIVVLVARSRGANDGVDSFRRQIDALSPEARRPVVDQVQNAADRHGSDAEPDEGDGAATDPDDEDGARGT